MGKLQMEKVETEVFMPRWLEQVRSDVLQQVQGWVRLPWYL